MSPAADLRVCVYVDPYPPAFGGHGIQLQRSLPDLMAAGISPTILTRRLDRSFGDPAAWPVDCVPVHRELSKGAGGTASVARAFQLRRHLRRHAGEYDIFHSAQMGWDLLLNLPTLKRRGVPVVVEMLLLGGDDPVSVSRSRFGKRKIEILRQVDAWIGISRPFLEALREVGIPEERSHLVYTGVDPEVYRPRAEKERRGLREKLDIPVEGRVVISAGSVIPRKGMDRCLRAWARACPEPGRDLLLITGPNRIENGLLPEAVEHAADLAREAEAPELAGTVRFLGRIENVHEYMGVSDAFLFLSRREGLGTVILEALASGLPCVVSPLDGIASELLDGCEAGWIAEDPDDSESVGAHLAELLADSDRRRRLGEAGRCLAATRFSMQSRAEALGAVYRSVWERAKG